ncbi:MAG TPA: zinc ribbon domain-containing protein, partial [Anaerolineales bacterium]|nr:zinc ribbon domain-containing protein [Anaerolineales bacterium]
MARKKLGVIELQWTCPNCSGLNPGSSRTCSNCGASQPADVQFTQAKRQELLTPEQAAKIEAAPDIHCPYCGTRNKASAAVCSQCGGDLVTGLKRQAGRVVGASQTGPAEQVICPTCTTPNPDTAL